MKTLKYLINSVVRKIKDWWKYVDTIIEVLLITIFGLYCTVLLFVIVAGAFKPTFKLNKEDWTCTQTVSTQTTMIVGKVILPKTQTDCVQYNRSY